MSRSAHPYIKWTIQRKAWMCKDQLDWMCKDPLDWMCKDPLDIDELTLTIFRAIWWMIGFNVALGFIVHFIEYSSRLYSAFHWIWLSAASYLGFIVHSIECSSRLYSVFHWMWLSAAHYLGFIVHFIDCGSPLSMGWLRFVGSLKL